MAPPADCFAISTPKASDTHYSTYLSLFGGTYKAGETVRARVQLVVAVSPDEKQIVRLYRAYLRDLGRVRE